MGDCCGVSRALYLQVALDWFYHRSAVKIPGFNPELVIREFPKIKAQADNYRKLRMNTRKIAGDDGIKSAHDGKFSGIFLREITKSEKFYFHPLQDIAYFNLMIAIIWKTR